MPSTVIKRFDYDEDNRVLVIEFVTGTRYRYFEVDKAVVEAFRRFREKGIFYNQQIKGKYAFEKILPGDAAGSAVI
ncbi:KTSC domain-containing protein [Paraflavitalea pollutisoli]|uniref:KTSC domain-containing protein n=1 Tax=Paraflavitalea pollutisoli TaxID=3034143 RepID=UPI0023EB540C|nr:KTSC domain-containing protein [Paraflavitalea sp. H1-2-19X]